MQKPSNYSEIQVTGEYTPIEAGGHKCVIKAVKEEKSKTAGLDMLVISLDTDKDDKQPNYFTEAYKKDTRDNKKWGCVMYLVVDDSTEYGPKNLKTLCTSVEKSNPGFTVQWGDGFANCFKDKKVGVVFGREQYLNNSNEVKWSTKPKWFRSTDGIYDVNVPNDKYLPNNSTPTSGYDCMNIPDGIDEELPFN